MNKGKVKQGHLFLEVAVVALSMLCFCCQNKNPRYGSKKYYDLLQEYYYIGDEGAYITERFAYTEELQKMGNRLLNDKSTFNSDLSRELDSLNISLTTSPDGKLKIYTWHDGCGGTMICHKSIYQTYSNGRFHADFLDDFVEFPLNIYQVESPKEPVYLIHFFFQESSAMSAMGIDAFKMDWHGRLKPAEVFECVREIHDKTSGYSDCVFMENYYNLPPSAFCAGGWSDNLFFKTTKKDLYMPYQHCQWEPYANEVMHDYYHHYVWDGEKFTYRNLEYNPMLAKYLDKAGWLILEFELGESIIRIDKMDDGTYRYVAWKKDKVFSALPDLIINNGWYHEVEHQFHFVNRDYEYIYNTTDAHLCIFQTDPKTGKRRMIADYQIEDVYSNDI